ncbi:MAG: hypothetical protein ACI92I_000434, partial [Acidimicrobiales bacterium]
TDLTSGSLELSVDGILVSSVTAGSKDYRVVDAASSVSIVAEDGSFDVSIGTFTDLFSVSAQEDNPSGMAFNNDGTKLYVVGKTGDDINEYDLSSAYDVSTGSYVDNFSVSAQEATPEGMAFNNDGTKLYVVGNTGDDINEYDLSSAYDVSTGSYVDNFSVSAQETIPIGMAFNNDGTKLYVIGTTGDDINEYNLSPAYDVSTGIYVDSFDVSAQDSAPQDMAFNNDGTKLYVLGSTGDDINEYDLFSAYDVSTGSYVDNFSVSAQETAPLGMAFNNDGTKLYVIGQTGDDINEYDISDLFAGTAHAAVSTESTSVLSLWTQNGSDISFAGGQVSIGTTTVDGYLTVQTTGTTDILNLYETSGTEVFTVLESGNVGIGTTTPSAKLAVNGLMYIAGTGTSTITDNLHVQGSLKIGTSSLYITTNGIKTTGDLVLEPGSGNDIIFGTDAESSVLFIDNTNNRVGIGTSTPSSMLTVGSTSTQQFLVSDLGVVTDGVWNASVIADAYITKTGAWTGTFDGYEATAFALDTDIGSTIQAYDADLTTWAGVTPSANGQSLVAGASYAAMRTLLDLEAGTDFYSMTAADTAFVSTGGDTISGGNLVMGGSAANIALGSNYLSGDGGDEGIYVDSTGNVGIGTTTPNRTLSVDGDLELTGQFYDETGSTGSAGDILQRTATGVVWGAPVVEVTETLVADDFSLHGTTLPEARSSQCFYTAGDNLYMAGGYNGSSHQTDIWAASTSDPTSWTDTGDTLPETFNCQNVITVGDNFIAYAAEVGYGGKTFWASTSDPTNWVDSGTTVPQNIAASMVIGDNVYAFGGRTGSTAFTDAIYWASTSDPTNLVDSGYNLPGALGEARVIQIGDYLYQYGGRYASVSYRKDIWQAPVNDPTNWSDTGVDVPGHHLGEASLMIVGDYVYMFATGGGSDIFRAHISTPTQVEDAGFNVYSSLRGGEAYVDNDYVYYYGGYDGSYRNYITYGIINSSNDGNGIDSSYNHDYLVLRNSTSTLGADLAELYPTTGTVSPADIVYFTNDNEYALTTDSGEGERPLAGIISTQPGQLLSDGTEGPTAQPLALSGRVPTKVNLENGPVLPGDRIAPSSVPGEGKKAGLFDKSVGTAITGYDIENTEETQLVTVFVDLQEGVNIADLTNVLFEGASTTFALPLAASLSLTTSAQMTASTSDTTDIVTTATSTEYTEVQSVSIWSRLADLASRFVDGTLALMGVITEKFTLGTSEIPAGATLYDAVTGNPYCLVVANGAPVSIAGVCEDIDLESYEFTSDAINIIESQDSSTTSSAVVTDVITESDNVSDINEMIGDVLDDIISTSTEQTSTTTDQTQPDMSTSTEQTNDSSDTELQHEPIVSTTEPSASSTDLVLEPPPEDAVPEILPPSLLPIVEALIPEPSIPEESQTPPIEESILEEPSVDLIPEPLMDNSAEETAV